MGMRKLLGQKGECCCKKLVSAVIILVFSLTLDSVQMPSSFLCFTQRKKETEMDVCTFKLI